MNETSSFSIIPFCCSIQWRVLYIFQVLFLKSLQTSMSLWKELILLQALLSNTEKFSNVLKLLMHSALIWNEPPHMLITFWKVDFALCLDFIHVHIFISYVFEHFSYSLMSYYFDWTQNVIMFIENIDHRMQFTRCDRNWTSSYDLRYYSIRHVIIVVQLLWRDVPCNFYAITLLSTIYENRKKHEEWMVDIKK